MIISKPDDQASYGNKNSIFLAGPSTRVEPNHIELRKFFGAITAWREEALTYLKDVKKFSGVVFVPEPFGNDYKAQIEWEDRRLNEAYIIVFWVPRDLEHLPGFTTNVEFGAWMATDKLVVLGYPEGAPKMRYLHYKADKYVIPVFHTLEKTLDEAVAWAGD